MSKKIFCKSCGGLRNHKKLHEEKRNGNDNDYLQWIDKYLIIECLGCNYVSFFHIYSDTEMTYQTKNGDIDYYEDETVYPYYLEQGSEIEYLSYLPKKIRDIYSETIASFKSKSLILTAGGLRAIIEAICNHLKIRKDSLDKRIDLLYKKGHLTLNESKRLHSIRFLGNDALHEIEKPKKKHLYLLLEIVNHLLANLFINDKKLEDNVETIIDTYDNFILLLKRCIKKEMINNNFTLKEILNTNIRRISKDKYSKFEDTLEDEIRNQKIDFIKIYDDTGKEYVYQIIKVPSYLFISKF